MANAVLQVLGQGTGLMLHLVNAAHSFPGGEQPSDPRGRLVKAWDLFPTCSAIPRPLHGPTEPGPQGIASPPSPSDRDGCQEPENSWMAAPGPRSLSAAFREHLRLLGLRDFPCGLGSWVGPGEHGGMGWAPQGAGGLWGAHCLSPLPLRRTSPALAHTRVPRGRRRMRTCHWVRRAPRL